MPGGGGPAGSLCGRASVASTADGRASPWDRGHSARKCRLCGQRAPSPRKPFRTCRIEPVSVGKHYVTLTPRECGRRLFFVGDVAQLGERLNGIQEVRGSIPLIST